MSSEKDPSSNQPDNAAFIARHHRTPSVTGDNKDKALKKKGGAGQLFSALFGKRDGGSDITLLQEIFEGSRGSRMVVDGKDRCIYFNQNFKDLCAEVGPPNYTSLCKLFEHHDETLAHFNLLADQAHRGLTDSIELFSKVGDNEQWFMVTAQPIKGYPGYIHWRLDDVTQRHTIDGAIREEREKLIDFTDNAPVGFFSVDESGHFVFANATFARWVGEDLKTLLSLGKLHIYLMEPPEGAAPYDLTEDAGDRQVVEIKMKGPSGEPFLASINQTIVKEPGGQVRTRAVVHDLTSEREMRRALEVSEDRFERFFEEAPLGILLLDKEGQITDYNAQFASLLCADMDSSEGLHFKELIDEADREEVVSAMERIEQGRQLEAPLEVTLNCSGKKVQTEMHARRFKGSNDIVLHFIDLTEKKQLEQQFVQSQKMQAIGQLAGGVAHDFNNLLTAMIGFCDLLLLRHKPGDPSFSDIMQIKQNANRASNLVRQLLAFSRQQTLRPAVHDMTDILTELSHLMRRLIGASIEMNIVHGRELGLVKVDEGQMEQVLINLAVNARDAMDGGGTLTIETENFTNREPMELVSEEMPPGHWTMIKVSDTGCGIEQENMTRIFEPFFTTKEKGHGTGLGLATVYGIIRQTDGYLDVKSKIGKGTTFSIYLPRSGGEEEMKQTGAQKMEEEASAKDLTGTECILLVEDEDAVRMFSQRALSTKGYEVMAADSGDSALELLKENPDKQIDLVVTDVVMPGIDGPTMVSTIREDNPKLKIIFMSGYTEDKLKEYMNDNVWFLPKPFTLQKLAEKVKEVLED